jgi:hypothetical protein
MIQSGLAPRVRLASTNSISLIWKTCPRNSRAMLIQPVAEIANAALENLLQIIDHTSSSFGVKRELSFDTSIIDHPPA